MDELETTQEGDVLTFASDKFSTFVIVEVKASEKTSEPEEPVYTQYYYWAEAQETTEDGSVVNVRGWYKGAPPTYADSEKMDAAPEKLTSKDHIIINCEPDEECKQWLKSLSGNVYRIQSSYKVEEDIQIGSPDATLQVSYLNAGNKGKMTIYADVLETLAVSCGNLEIYGNVTASKITLGDPVNYLQSNTIKISGNVEHIEWYQKELVYNAHIDKNVYMGFDGTFEVGGTVKSGAIYTKVYDEAIDSEVWKQTGAFGPCEKGTCKINAGVLSENVVVTEQQPQLGNYTFGYWLINNGDCVKEAFDAETGESVATLDWQLADVPDGADMKIQSTAPGETTVININLNKLQIKPASSKHEVNVIINGNVAELDATCNNGKTNAEISGNVTELYTACSQINESVEANIKIAGDVTNARVGLAPEKNYQVYVDGTIKNGTVLLKATEELRKFTISNLQVIKDGELGEGVFLKKELDIFLLDMSQLQNKRLRKL